MRCVLHAACAAVWKLHGTQMRELALLVGARAPIKA